MRSNIIFSRLNEQQVQLLQQVMSEHHVSAGQNVVTQGEKGNHFYVVDAGELDVYIRWAHPLLSLMCPRALYGQFLTHGSNWRRSCCWHAIQPLLSLRCYYYSTRPPATHHQHTHRHRPDGSLEEQAVKAFGSGDSFGELALMYNCPRTATIRARTDVVLWSLDRVSFRMIVLEANTKKTTM